MNVKETLAGDTGWRNRHRTGNQTCGGQTNERHDRTGGNDERSEEFERLSEARERRNEAKGDGVIDERRDEERQRKEE